MQIHVYGCGFAGLVSALGWRKSGFTVHAVDIDPNRILQLRRGEVPFGDSKLTEALAQFHGDRLHFHHLGEEPGETDGVVIAVPTPPHKDGLDLRNILDCLSHLSSHVQWRGDSVVLIRSTLPLGGLAQIRAQCAQLPGLSTRLRLVYFPEFMREGTGLDDWDNPPLLVIGCDEESLPPKVAELLHGRKFQKTSSSAAEVLKLASNAYHAMKVTFANEIMRISEPLGVSPEEVMNLFCMDTKLNLSRQYLHPGFAWGGPCLEKDIRALTALPAELPLLSSLADSNTRHIEYYLQKILKTGAPRVAFVGLSFKSAVNDMRSSPSLELAMALAREAPIEQITLFQPDASDTQLPSDGGKIRWVREWADLSRADFYVTQKSWTEKLTQVLGNVARLEI